MISACFYKYIVNVIVVSRRHPQSWNLAVIEHIDNSQCIMGLCELIHPPLSGDIKQTNISTSVEAQIERKSHTHCVVLCACNYMGQYKW